jgi:hypothetical protein
MAVTKPQDCPASPAASRDAVINQIHHAGSLGIKKSLHDGFCSFMSPPLNY